MTENQAAGRGTAGNSVSDDERQRVAERLTEAVGQGKLTLHEFAQRVDAAYGANTHGELDAVVADLPAPDGDAPVEPAKPQGKRHWKLSVMGGSKYQGRWRIPTVSGFFALMGGSQLDLREATLDTAEIDIKLVSIMGGHKVLVPRGVRVEVNDTDVIGGTKLTIDRESAPPNAPVVRIRTVSVLGGNKIMHPEDD